MLKNMEKMKTVSVKTYEVTPISTLYWDTKMTPENNFYFWKVISQSEVLADSRDTYCLVVQSDQSMFKWKIVEL